MAIKLYKPITPGMRFGSVVRSDNLTTTNPYKKLRRILPKKSGRGAGGRVTVRHQGGREKRFLREIDWNRDKRDMKAMVVSVEYDPNRSANIAMLQYVDGKRRYILAPDGLAVGQSIMNGEDAPLTSGNSLPLKAIPVGTPIHALEIAAGRGAQMVRGAGTAATIMGFEEANALVKLPSGEVRRFPLSAYATIGQVGNSDWKNVVWGKAGRKRHLGIRPTVRGTAQNPRSHPHGGGEGRSGEGMHPKTPWGKSARGKKTRKKTRYSDYLIVQRRK